ncbi:MAG TPA: hypothetical protein VFR97_14550, partial [Capillimicrobium sp.]|nr:hypothetical protein [Capillimicrobium sp.]
MAGRFARLRRSRDDDPAPTEATEVLPATDDGAAAPEDGATAATQVQVLEPAAGEAAEGAQAAEGDGTAATEVAPPREPGFISRGRMRRRLRYVRRAREIALR